MRMLLLLLTLSVIATTLAGGCSDGPMYWCQNCENVKECYYLVKDVDSLMKICVKLGLLVPGQCTGQDDGTAEVTDYKETATPTQTKEPTQQPTDIPTNQPTKQPTYEATNPPTTSPPTGLETENSATTQVDPSTGQPTDPPSTIPVTEPTQRVTEPTQRVTEPTNGVTNPTDGVTNPTEGVTNPTYGVTNPTEYVTGPTYGVTGPTESVTGPTANDIGENQQTDKDALNRLSTARVDRSNGTSTCSVFGRGSQHVVTFDGLLYSVQAECSYVINMDCSGARSWMIYGQLAECGEGVTCLTGATIYYGNAYIVLDRGWTAYHNGEVLKLKLRETVRFGDIALFFDGLYLGVNLPNGVSISWNGLHTIHITIPENNSHTCGLCGSKDRQTGNDLTTRTDGLTENVATFTDSWKIDRLGLCPDVRSVVNQKIICGGKHRNVGALYCQAVFSEKTVDECETNGLDKTWFIEQCVEDWCTAQTSSPATDTPNVVECDVMAAYVKRCTLSGLGAVNEYWWRASSGCPSEQTAQQYTLLESIAPWHQQYEGITD